MFVFNINQLRIQIYTANVFGKVALLLNFMDIDITVTFVQLQESSRVFF